MTRTWGFGCRARQGKDTCVKAIIDGYNPPYKIRRYAFADALKREVSEALEMNGGIGGLFDRWDKGLLDLPPRPAWVYAEQDPARDDPLCPQGKYRSLLMFWGTEYRRRQHPNYWVAKVAAEILADQPDYALIADLRFPNEFDWVKSVGGVTVRILRHGYKIPSTHISESALDAFPFDYELSAPEGCVGTLRDRAVGLFAEIIRKP